MAIKSDDSDIRAAWLYTEVGGNGDYYITIVEEKQHHERKALVKVSSSIRITTHGNRYHPDVVKAVANLYRVLEEHRLNERDFR